MNNPNLNAENILKFIEEQNLNAEKQKRERLMKFISERSKLSSKSTNETLNKFLKLRATSIIALVLLILLVVALYIWNPWKIMSHYGGPVVFFTLFIGIIFMIMISIYQYYISNPNKGSMFYNKSTFLSYFLKGIIALFSIALLGVLIYFALKLMGVFEQDASKTQNVIHIVFNLLLLCIVLGILYKLATTYSSSSKNIASSSKSYLTALLTSFFSFISSNVKATKPSELKILGLGSVLLGGYFVWSRLLGPLLKDLYLKQGGKQWIKEPVSTNVLTNVASYQTLSGNEDSDTFNYRYAISFWFYLDSFPPSTNASYLGLSPLLSFGENPAIKYSSENNTLYVTVKDARQPSLTEGTKDLDSNAVQSWMNNKDLNKDTNNNNTINKNANANNRDTNINNTKASIENIKADSSSFSNELDSEGRRIIYKHPDVLLQKWNHIVLNYSGGTLDVFYNGKLVKSAIQVVPYIKYDMLTVGKENGIYGNVANLLFFQQPLDVLTVNTLYTSMKDKSPPI